MRGVNSYRTTESSPAGLMMVERDALLRSARALEVAGDLVTPELSDALHVNNQLWTALAFDCASDGNQLPQSLRANIISLAMWVVGHSAKVLKSEARVAPIVEVNRNVAAGVDAAIRNFHQEAPQKAGAGADLIG